MRTVDWPLMPGDGRAVGDDGPDVGRAADSRHAGQRGRDRNPGRGASRQPSSSADGRLVAFSSTATTLVAGDTNGSAGAVTRLGDVCPLAAAPFSVMRIGGTIESDGPPIVVERSTYWSADGQFWAAGASALLTRLP